MPVRNANLLLSDAAAPDNGLALVNVIQWFGGPLSITATGTFAGASAEVMACTKAPVGGDRQDYIDNASAYDWVSLHTFTGPDTFELDNLNPCGLAIRITGRHADTRAKVIVS